MAKLLTCEWDSNSVRLLATHVQGNNLAIDKMVEVAISKEPDPESALSPLESALATAAQSAGIRGQTDVVFVLRRAQTEMRLLTLPNIPADELPDTVRFQVAQEFNTADDGPIDFVVLGETNDNRIFVSVATVSPEMLADVIATTNMAELTSSSVVLSSFSIAHFLHSQNPTPQHRLIVDLLDGEIELTVAHNGMAQFARSVKLPESGVTTQRVLSEVRRTMASYSNQPTPGNIELATIVGTSTFHQELQDQLSLHLKIDIELYDPLDDCIVTSLENDETTAPEEPAQFTALIGAAFQIQIGQTSQLDFVNPRKPPAPASAIRQNSKYIIGGFVLLVLAAFLLIRPIVTTQSNIAELQTSLEDKTSIDKANKTLTDRLQQVRSFENSRVNWLDELVLVSNKFPPARQAMVDRFTAKTSTSNRSTEIRGQILLDVHLLNDDSLRMLETNLLTPAYTITGNGFRSDPENVAYPWTVVEHIRLISPPLQNKNDKNKSKADGESPTVNQKSEKDQSNSKPLQTTNAPVQTKVKEL
ncbi:MAG: hypothetical protein HN617_07070 [Planctomycetaceae bacterium]|jgi:Tfp pilus assembly PilM family ATPase|nr:hypothetical protein [Planctomycetaceae bacterium]MBT4725443.1 hypothetical protein [Planctomycetaceae bacterium]MBT4845863.1 hypothetical protein [Planctomycetaceae bacterium]MBT5123186.1 hypothetical protein [Planctomycetaceae bacterium]MBT5598880.1 hypothetical protein [Planctomycetaceae bacterium]